MAQLVAEEGMLVKCQKCRQSTGVVKKILRGEIFIEWKTPGSQVIPSAGSLRLAEHLLKYCPHCRMSAV